VTTPVLDTTTLMLPRDGYGDVIFNVEYPGDGTRITTCAHADPRIRISDVIVDQLASGGLVPEASMTLPDGTPATKAPGTPLSLLGAVITFTCANRRLVYRITGWEQVWLEGDAKRGSYLAEWPD
jgi:hypothetical protein